jgi:hypothetical protein
MLGKDARCRNRLGDLRQFLQTFCPLLDKTRGKFFRQSLVGTLLSKSLVVARWLKWIPDRCKRPFYRQKRLLNQLKSHDWDHQKVIRQYQQVWARRIEPDTPLIVDLSDLARPRARRLKYLSLVRDGSEDGKLVNGYWCIEIYAYWGKGRITPMCLHPYSIEDPSVLSENAEILKRVGQVFTATQGRGVLVMDIGADRDNLLIPWINDRRQFVVRLRGDRHLLLDNGSGGEACRVHVQALHLAEHLLAPSPDCRHAWCRVYLPERPNNPLYLVCKQVQGHDRPLMLLTALTVQNLDGAKRVLDYYRRRWKCEEAARFLKSELGLERFALRVYEAFGPLLLVAMLAMSFLTWLQLHFASLPRWLASASPGRHQIKFVYYRVLHWLQQQILPLSLKRIPP